MNLSELQSKDIINIETGDNLGRIIDVQMDEVGNILSFITEPKKIIKRIFKNDHNSIKFSQIKKIGPDVILVKE